MTCIHPNGQIMSSVAPWMSVSVSSTLILSSCSEFILIIADFLLHSFIQAIRCPGLYTCLSIWLRLRILQCQMWNTTSVSATLNSIQTAGFFWNEDFTYKTINGIYIYICWNVHSLVTWSTWFLIDLGCLKTTWMVPGYYWGFCFATQASVSFHCLMLRSLCKYL